MSRKNEPQTYKAATLPRMVKAPDAVTPALRGGGEEVVSVMASSMKSQRREQEKSAAGEQCVKRYSKRRVHETQELADEPLEPSRPSDESKQWFEGRDATERGRRLTVFPARPPKEGGPRSRARRVASPSLWVRKGREQRAVMGQFPLSP